MPRKTRRKLDIWRKEGEGQRPTTTALFEPVGHARYRKSSTRRLAQTAPPPGRRAGSPQTRRRRRCRWCRRERAGGRERQGTRPHVRPCRASGGTRCGTRRAEGQLGRRQERGAKCAHGKNQMRAARGTAGTIWKPSGSLVCARGGRGQLAAQSSRRQRCDTPPLQDRAVVVTLHAVDHERGDEGCRSTSAASVSASRARSGATARETHLPSRAQTAGASSDGRESRGGQSRSGRAGRGTTAGRWRVRRKSCGRERGTRSAERAFNEKEGRTTHRPASIMPPFRAPVWSAPPKMKMSAPTKMAFLRPNASAT